MTEYLIDVSPRGIVVSFYKDGHCFDQVEFPAPELQPHPSGVVCVECAEAHQGDPIGHPEPGIYIDELEAWQKHTFEKFIRWAKHLRASDVIYRGSPGESTWVEIRPRFDLTPPEKEYRSVSPEDEERGQQAGDQPWYNRND